MGHSGGTTVMSHSIYRTISNLIFCRRVYIFMMRSYNVIDRQCISWPRKMSFCFRFFSRGRLRWNLNFLTNDHLRVIKSVASSIMTRTILCFDNFPKRLNKCEAANERSRICKPRGGGVVGVTSYQYSLVINQVLAWILSHFTSD